MELINLEKAFKNHTFRTEEDVKIHFHADLVEPLLKELNPARANQYRSEDITSCRRQNGCHISEYIF